MACRSAPQWTTMRLKLPRGFEDFWSLMLELDARQGSFTTAEIVGETNVQRQSVEHYVARLAAAGIVKLVEQRRRAPMLRENVYRLARRPKAAPRVRADGTVIARTAQECLWTSIRSLVTFTTRDLAFAATVDRPVRLKTAQRYVNELARAGYLTAHHPHGSRRPAVYRLKPAMNTGPQPPSVLVTEQVWDRNLKKIVGDTVSALQEAER